LDNDYDEQRRKEFSTAGLGKRTDRYKNKRRYHKQVSEHSGGLEPHGHRWVLLAAVALLAVLILGGGIYAAWNAGYLSLSGSDGGTAAEGSPASAGTVTNTSLSPEEQALAEMTIEQKIGQMMMVGFDGQTAGDDIWSLITEKWIGAVVLFDRNLGTEQQIAGLNDSLQEMAVNARQPYRLMVAIDQEGGKTRRIDSIGPVDSEPMIGAMGDQAANAARQEATQAAEGLAQIGINTNLAPVVDVSDGEGSVMDLRSYGTDPALVAKLGTMAVRGYVDAGTVSCPKHFPGHGSADADSHEGLPQVDTSREVMDQYELLPFNAVIKEGAPMIMVGHLVVPALDGSGTPASMSQPIITGLLRKQMGFSGVVITDDLEMSAITDSWDLGDAAVRAVQAGADMVIVAHTYDQQLAAYEALLDAVKSGQISEDRIDESVKRILAMKDDYGMAAPG
jgi:beta-N-acetylhexosaminidase